MKRTVVAMMMITGSEPFDESVGSAFLREDLVDVRLNGRIQVNHCLLNLTLKRALQHVLGHNIIRPEPKHIQHNTHTSDSKRLINAQQEPSTRTISMMMKDELLQNGCSHIYKSPVSQSVKSIKDFT